MVLPDLFPRADDPLVGHQGRLVLLVDAHLLEVEPGEVGALQHGPPLVELVVSPGRRMIDPLELDVEALEPGALLLPEDQQLLHPLPIGRGHGRGGLRVGRDLVLGRGRLDVIDLRTRHRETRRPADDQQRQGVPSIASHGRSSSMFPARGRPRTESHPIERPGRRDPNSELTRDRLKPPDQPGRRRGALEPWPVRHLCTKGRPVIGRLGLTKSFEFPRANPSFGQTACRLEAKVGNSGSPSREVRRRSGIPLAIP